MATQTGTLFFLRNDPYSPSSPNTPANNGNQGVNKDGVNLGAETSSTVVVNGSNSWFSYTTEYASLTIDPSAQSYFFVDESGVTSVSNGVPTATGYPLIRSGSTTTGAVNPTALYSGPTIPSPGPNDYGLINDLAVDQVNRRIYFTQAYVTGGTNANTGDRIGSPNTSLSGLYYISETGGAAVRVTGTGGLASPNVVALDLADNIAFVTDVTGVGLDGGTQAAVNNLDAVNLTTGAVQVLFSEPFHPDGSFGSDYYGGNVLDGLAVDPTGHTLYYTTNNIFNILSTATYSDTQDGIYKVSFSVSSGRVSLGTTTTLYSGANAFDPARIEIDAKNGVFYVAGNTQKYDAALQSPGPYDDAIYEGSLTANNTTALTRVTPKSETAGTASGDSSDPHGENLGGYSIGGTPFEAAGIGYDSVPIIVAGSTINYVSGASAAAVDAGLTLGSSTSVNFISASVAIAGAVTGDVLAATTTGTSITASLSGSTLTLSGTDTTAHYQQVLDSVTFRNTTTNPTNSGASISRTLTYSAYDGINTGTATSTVNIQTAPVVTAGSPGTTFTGGGAVVVADNVLTLIDYTSSAMASATVSITAGFLAGDTLGFTAQNGISGIYNATTGVLNLSGTATTAQYQAALRSITFGFSPSNGNPAAGNDTSRTLSYTVSDGALSSTAVTSAITVVHAPPTISAGASNAVTFVRGSTSVITDATATVTAPDSSGTIASATISITGGFTPGDTLAATAASGITGAYNATTGVLTLTGPATAAQFQTILDGITFSTTTTAATGTRTLAYLVNDGTANSTAATSTVNVVAPTPAIAGTGANQAVADNGTISPFGNITITDAAGETETATLTVKAGSAASDANGLLSGSGLTKTGTGTYTIGASTPAGLQAALRALVFTPTANEVAPGSTVTTQFGIALADAGGGTASNTGTTVVATAVNDPPAIAGTTANQPVSDEATLAPFANTTITDPDFGASEASTITVTAGGVASDANGLLSGTGLTKTGTGTYTLAAASPAAATTALQGLVFTPTAHQVAPGSTVATKFTLAVSDGIATTSNATTSVIATASTDAPTISGTAAGQATTDQAPVQPFAQVTIGEVDFGATPTITITLTASGAATDANGILSGTGLTKTGTGTYSLAAASPATLTSEIRALTFTPTIDQVPLGQVVTTGFTILASHLGTNTTDSNTSVRSTEVPCFVRGTLIATTRGQVAVEDLAPGDQAILATGGTAPIIWIGHRVVDCTRHPAQNDVWPIRIAVDAFGPGLPHRELRLSPGHAVFVEGVLAPAFYLQNGASVRQEKVDRVSYFHIELDHHDILLAEGMPSESYLECNNRDAFENSGPAMALHPDFGPNQAHAPSRFERVIDGPALARARHTLLSRLDDAGATTADPGLTIMAGTTALRPDASGAYAIPPGTRTLQLLSRHARPRDIEDSNRDDRSLGIRVRSLHLDGAALPLGDARLGEGWSFVEPEHRWTLGAATLDVGGARHLVLDYAGLCRYPALFEEAEPLRLEVNGTGATGLRVHAPASPAYPQLPFGMEVGFDAGLGARLDREGHFTHGPLTQAAFSLGQAIRGANTLTLAIPPHAGDTVIVMLRLAAHGPAPTPLTIASPHATLWSGTIDGPTRTIQFALPPGPTTTSWPLHLTLSHPGASPDRLIIIPAHDTRTRIDVLSKLAGL